MIFYKDKIVLNGDKKEIFLSRDFGQAWLMKINKNNQIEFNREVYPNLSADDFAEEVVKILENVCLKP